MFVALALAFPVMLLLATLGMELVERPLDPLRARRQRKSLHPATHAAPPPVAVASTAHLGGHPEGETNAAGA